MMFKLDYGFSLATIVTCLELTLRFKIAKRRKCLPDELIEHKTDLYEDISSGSISMAEEREEYEK